MRASVERLLSCVVVLFLIGAALPGRAFGQPQQSVTGVPGRETARAVVTFTATASQGGGFSATAYQKAPKHEPFPHQLSVPEGLAAPTDPVIEPMKQVPDAREVMAASPPLASSFNALDDNNTSIPPDVHGAAGPNHLMTTLNTQVRIQEKDGDLVSTTSLDAFWATLGNPDVFDPKIFYDPYAARWVFTAVANALDATSAVLIGVSATNNPTGSWYIFSIDADAGNILWADYPSIGFNNNWIVVQLNMYGVASPHPFDHSNIYVFKKADLYANVAATHTLIELDNSYGAVQCPAMTYDNSIGTMYLLQDWNGNSGGSGYLRLYTITGAIGAETITPGGFIGTANPWHYEGGNGNDFAPQQGTAAKIQTNDSRMQNLVYRNGSLWATHTVFLPAATPTRSSIQFWEVTTAGAITQRARIDDGTGTYFYAYPSLAVNSTEDVLIGYSGFTASSYASAYYSYRSSSDAVSTLRDRATLKAGANTYYKTFGGAKNRWGDYTATVVDPTNDVDLWTIGQYASATANRWGTWWGRVALEAVPFTDGVAPDYRTDNGSTAAINLGFTFSFYGTDYTQVYINNNGTLSFGGAVASGNATSFPTVATPMIAPFWADVDTRHASSGLVYYGLEANKLTVVWSGVGYSSMKADKTNAFQVVITDGTDASIGTGKNVQFSYNDMEWTTGDNSGGSGGFGGTAATAGINRGDGTNSILLGRFDTAEEVDFLDTKEFSYDVSTAGGVPEWTSTYGVAAGKRTEDMGFVIPTIAKRMTRNLAVDAGGNVYVTGSSDSTTKLDYLTVKYDGHGNEFWRARYNGGANKHDKAYAIAVDASGNVYVTGESESASAKADVLTVKYSPLGVEEWTARYNNSPVNKKDAGYAIALSPAGTIVYVTGESVGGATKSDFITIAYDASTGAGLWSARYDGGASKVDKAYAMAIDGAGNVVVTGESVGPTAKIDFATIVYTGGMAGGAVVSGWPQRYDQLLKKDYPFAVAIDAADNVIVAGGSESATKLDYAVVKYNSAGVQQWASTYNNSLVNKNDIAYAVGVDAGGNVYVTGASEGSGSKYDYATVRYNSDGSQEWVSRYGLPKVDIARSLAVSDALGAVFITGSSEQGTAKANFMTQRLSTVDGSADWVGTFDGGLSKADIGYNVALQPGSNGVVLAGIGYTGSKSKNDFAVVQGDPGDAVPGAVSAPVAFDETSLEDEETPRAFALHGNYPNPFNPQTTFRFDLPAPAMATLTVYNLLGQQVARVLDGEALPEGAHEIQFDAGRLASGVYFYKLDAMIVEENGDATVASQSFSGVGKMVVMR